jgi:hypothetical protein
MNIRRVNPIPWKTGNACAPMTVPHMSRPPCHGDREQQSQTRFVKAIGFGNETEPGNNNHHEYRSRTKVPKRTGGMQEADLVVQTLEFKFRKILKIIRIVVGEQVLKRWHRLDDRNVGLLFFQKNNCRVCKRFKVWCDYDVPASRLLDEMGNTRRRIPRRNREGDTFSADNS